MQVGRGTKDDGVSAKMEWGADGTRKYIVSKNADLADLYARPLMPS